MELQAKMLIDIGSVELGVNFEENCGKCLSLKLSPQKRKLKKIGNTTMHSSRMRTDCCSGHH